MTLQNQKSFIDKLHRQLQHERPTDAVEAAEIEAEIAALKEVSDTLDEMDRMLAFLSFLQSKQGQ